MDNYTYEPALERVPTHVFGLDHVLIGGIVAGRITLVSGTSGSGKTLLCCQILHNLIVEEDRNCIFVTCEERYSDIRKNVATLGWDFQKHEDDGKLTVIESTPDFTITEVGDFQLSGMISQIKNAIQESGASVVVFDSMSALFQRFENSGIIRREVYRVSEMLKELNVTGLMTTERNSEYGDLSRHGVEEFVSDCVIVLRQNLLEERLRRTLQVFKLRGDLHQTGEYPLTITREGMFLLPLSARELTQPSGSQRLSFGNDTLNEMAGGGLFRDSIVLVSGPTGSGKTMLCTTFAAQACRDGKRTLYCGFEESRAQLTRNASAWGYDFAKWEEAGLLKLNCRYPEVDSLEGHLLRIREEVEDFQPERVVVDSVSALERISHIRNFREFIISLTSFLKQQEVATFFASNSTDISGGESITDAHISTITDSIIILRYIEIDGDFRRGVLIIKMRGSQHDKTIREFEIDGNGLTIGDPIRNISSIVLKNMSAAKKDD